MGSDSVLQILRTVEFRINKRYLKNRFWNWVLNNRFWMVAFAEGGDHIHEKHYHVLLHSPNVIHKKAWWFADKFAFDFKLEWLRATNRSFDELFSCKKEINLYR